jgi:hypothetical protein
VATTVVRQSCRIPLEEVSAVCARRAAAGHELLAIGDDEYAVVVTTLAGTEFGEATTSDLVDLLPAGTRSAGDGSEWEGVATDRDGKVFVLRESSGTVLVFSPGLEELCQTIQLDVSDSEEPAVAAFFDDPNAAAEALVLLPPHDVLVAKQRDPVLFVQFGPLGGESILEGRPPLARDPLFEIAPDSRATLVALRHWTMPGHDEHELESVNDLAVDGGGRLHAISSKSRRIHRLDVREGEVRIEKSWKLAEEIGVSKHRRPEGLAFDPDDRPLVALDTKERGDNLFLLERLD